MGIPDYGYAICGIIGRELKNHGMVWGERDLKHHPVPRAIGTNAGTFAFWMQKLRIAENIPTPLTGQILQLLIAAQNLSLNQDELLAKTLKFLIERSRHPPQLMGCSFEHT